MGISIKNIEHVKYIMKNIKVGSIVYYGKNNTIGKVIDIEDCNGNNDIICDTCIGKITINNDLYNIAFCSMNYCYVENNTYYYECTIKNIITDFIKEEEFSV